MESCPPPARRRAAVVELPQNCVLIGVDAGATEVKVHQVVVVAAGAAPVLRIGTASASCCYDRASGFRPAPLDQQIRALERGAIELDETERRQGRLWIEAAAGSILSVAAQARRTRVLVGIGAPGVKTADGLGIALMRNGPRIPEYAVGLAALLDDGGLELAQPVGPLSGDGDDCGRGEEVDRHGLFRGVQNAYYVGGGTGVAEALKLRGRLVPLDGTRRWLRKAWQMTTATGRSFDDALSTRGINEIYAADSGRPYPIEQLELPEERAAAGDVVADGVMKEAAHALAELVFERMVTLRRGRQDDSSRGEAYLALEGALEARHPYLGTFLDRVVIGQRLGRIFGEPKLARVFKERVEDALAHRLRSSPFSRMRARYLQGERHGERLKPGFLRASHLRSAPALGAAAAALEARTGASQVPG